MSRLAARLDRIREGFEEKAPAAALEVMHRATSDLRASGIEAGFPAVGSRLPAFELDGLGRRAEGLDRSLDVLADHRVEHRLP